MRFPSITPHALFLACALALVAGCHSAHVDITVENRTGAPLRELEVDYPSASFGSDQLAAGATMHYRIQVQGQGPVKVQYAAANGKQPQTQGPALAQGQQGTLEVVLLPEGKAEFHPRLSKPD
jgi:hypothetical protein